MQPAVDANGNKTFLVHPNEESHTVDGQLKKLIRDGAGFLSGEEKVKAFKAHNQQSKYTASNVQVPWKYAAEKEISDTFYNCIEGTSGTVLSLSNFEQKQKEKERN